MMGSDEATKPLESLVELLERRAREAPESLLFSYLSDSETEEEARLTRDQLDTRARKIAARLRERGLSGSTAVLLFPHGLEFIAAFFGCLYARVIAVPAYLPRPNRPMSPLRSILIDAAPRAVLSCKSQESNIDRWYDGMPELRATDLVITDESASSSWAGAEAWNNSNDDLRRPALIQYTSGSTGNPKGVVLTHENLLHNCRLIQDCFGSTAESRGVFWLPLFHDMGLIGGVIQTLFCGGQSTLLSPVAFLQRPLRWLETIARKSATISGGPNFAYEYCIEKSTPKQRAALDLSSWEVAFNGAEPIRHTTLDRFAEAFAPAGFRKESFTACYGLAEATLFVTGTRRATIPATIAVDPTLLDQAIVAEPESQQQARILVGSGQVGAGTDLLIVDRQTGLPCSSDRVGEIWVSGKSVTGGYWNRPVETEELLSVRFPDREGPRYVRTGDLGFVRDGELFVTGRCKDLIIVRGRNIYPQDIEWTAERSHLLARSSGAAAFGVEAQGQEQLVVVQEIDRTREPQTLQSIEGAIRQAIAIEHDVDIFAIVLIKAHSLPRTSSGKVQRGRCRSEYLEGRLDSIAVWTRPTNLAANGHRTLEVPTAAASRETPKRTRTEIEQWLRRRLAEQLGCPPGDIDPRRALASLGISSIGAVSLSGELERWLERPFSPILLYEHTTIHSLVDFLAGETGRQGQAATQPVTPLPERTGEPVAVIGLGCRFPGASGPEAFWQLLRQGIEAVGPVPPSRWSLEVSQAREIPHRGGFLDDVVGFNPQFFGISPREAELIDPQQRLLLEVTWEALEHAGQVPSRLAGMPVGVFIGIATSDYAHLQAMRECCSDPYRITGSAASIAANRISYTFDFHGPSIAVDTACSSSLLTVHLACRSLIEGESTLALAGGVNLMLAPEIAQNFARVGFLSQDGKCRAFDAQANGYVRGEGAGVVVLKRLSRALADQDEILALIRGSAVNQDGRSNGLTAPSRTAQESVIREACRRAGIVAAEVDYVEAHGTGTPLGDPIEASALGSVLSIDRNSDRPCAVGSVKTNIGHLEAAAGIAGLIKTVLALSHRELPPSLNYVEPNPHIPLESLGLKIQQALGPWPPSNRPALAGVSALGFGGTNVHVILEEWPAADAPSKPTGDEERRLTLLPFSAQSPLALRESILAVRDLIETSAPALSLHDLAYTASVRREHMQERMVILANSRAEAIERIDRFLGGASHADLWRGRQPSAGGPKLAFVFSGQGGSWPGAGSDLFNSEPVFQAAFVDCMLALTRWTGLPLMEAMEHPERFRAGDPGFDQPVHFALQVALVALWKSWGIVPEIVLGHSLGEIAAAYSAGGLTLDDAAQIVALRGLAMRSRAGRGLTLAAALSAEEARSRLLGRDDLFLSAINGPQSVTVSGTPEAVREFAAAMRNEGRRAHILDVEIAFHCPHMDLPSQELRSGLLHLKPSTLAAHLISTVTGNAIRGEDLTADYWARNVREPVLFTTAMGVLRGEGVDAVLEIGPHPVLAPSITECLASNGAPLVLGTLRRGDQSRKSLLRSLAALYVKGFEIDWAKLTPLGRLVQLPAYAWQRERYWLSGQAPPSSNGSSHQANHKRRNGKVAPTSPPRKTRHKGTSGLHQRGGSGTKGRHDARSESPNGQAAAQGVGRLRTSSTRWQLRWQEERSSARGPVDLSGHWLILGDPRGIATALAQAIRLRGGSCTIRGSQIPRDGNGPLGFTFSPGFTGSLPSESDSVTLSAPIRGIISLEAIEFASVQIDGLLDLEVGHHKLLEGLLELGRSLASREFGDQVRLWVVTRGAQPVREGQDRPCLIQAPLAGFARALALEQPGLWGGLIDLDPAASESEAARLAEAIGARDSDTELALRGEARYTPRLVPLADEETRASGFKIRPEGTYVITGGLGDLGLQVARLLARRGARRLVLVGKSGLPDRTDWHQVAMGTSLYTRVEAVRDLESRGVTVLPVAADVADPAAISTLFQELRRTWPPIRGIIHAAGVVRPGSLEDLDIKAFSETLGPKVSGSWLLHEQTDKLPLDFFLLFSSIASVCGSPKLLDYCAANAFLDALAHHRRSNGLPAQAINFGPWAQMGMATKEGRDRILPLIGLKPLAARSALGLLESVASLDAAQTVIADADWTTLNEGLGRSGRSRLLEQVLERLRLKRDAGSDSRGQADLLSALPHAERSERLISHIRSGLCEVLKLAPEQIDTARPLVHLGLDSLTALELKATVEKELGIVLPLSALLEGSTLRSLAEKLAGSLSNRPSEQSEATTSSREEPSRALSAGQETLWYAHQFNSASGAYNISGAGRLRGELDLAALERALGHLVQRHESLRTCFSVVKDQPCACVLDASDRKSEDFARICHEVVAGWDDDRLKIRLSELTRQPFELERGPLFRVVVLSRSGAEHIIFFCFHHIISDFRSITVFVDELGQLYVSERQGLSPELPAPLCKYGDFRDWQARMIAGDVGSQHWAYWREQLSGTLPVMDLPADHPRPKVRSYRGSSLHFSMDESLSRAISEFGRASGSSLYVTLLAAFQVLLSRYTAQRDLIVGSPASGRTQPQWRGTIGYFVNILPMRCDLSDNPSFREFLEKVRRTVVEGLEHQDFPFSQMVSRLQLRPDLSREPLVQVVFAWQNAPLEALSLGGVALQPVELETNTSKFDLSLSMQEADGRLVGQLEYSTDLFERATMERLLGHWQVLLQEIVADPQQRVDELPLLTEKERRQLLVEWNDTAAAYPHDRCVHQLFEDQVRRTPQATAVVFEDLRLTYAELNAQANQLAHYLRERGVGPEVLVGICVERSLEMVVGLLGILKAGGAYVPLDPDYPSERLAFMLQDAQIKLLLTQERLLDRLPEHEAHRACLDRDWAKIAGHPRADLTCVAAAGNLAYVIYTSGSTGTPKGVLIEHRSVVSSTHSRLSYRQSAPPRSILVPSIAFDSSVAVFFATLCQGGVLVLPNDSYRLNVNGLADLIERHQVTHWLSVPSLYETLINECTEKLTSLKYAIVAGEPCPRHLPALHHSLLHDVKLFNEYGPTEATVWSTVIDIADIEVSNSVAIGRPIARTQVYVLDENHQPPPIGVAGELYIGGVQLARGYLNRPRLTAEMFIPDPFSDQPNARLYRTGDLCRWLPDGNLEFLGRIDHQVKIRGLRIELGEIEAALASHPQVRDAVVLCREDQPGQKRLVGYLVPTAENIALPPSVGALRQHLQQTLPEYMVPAAFVALPQLPLTPNGKVDRKALPDPTLPGIRLTPLDVPPRGPVEMAVAEILEDLLRIEHVGAHSNFFDLGGHSLTAIQCLARIQRTFHIEIPVRDFVAAPTVAQLSQLIEKAITDSKPAGASEMPRAERQGPLPASFAQQRLWYLDQLEPNSSSYVISAAVRLEGRLNVPALERALGEVVSRHEVLRTLIKSRDGVPFQVIQPEMHLVLEQEDCSNLDAEDRDAALASRLATLASAPFDLARGPLIRARLLKLGPDEHVVLVTMHHIVSDGWSMGILIREVSALYEAFAGGHTSPLPQLPIQYADYALWQRNWMTGEVLQTQLNYWHNRLAAVPELDLATDRPRSAVPSPMGRHLTRLLPRPLLQAARTLSRDSGATLFMTLLALFKVLLYRYCGQDDIAVGSPIAGRTRLELESLIGFFVNTLVLRTDLTGDPSFRTLLARVRQTAIEAYSHQDLPFEKLVEELQPQRQYSRTPLFQVMFALQNAPLPPLQSPQLVLRTLETNPPTAKFDLTLFAWESSEGLKLTMEYNAGLFEAATIERMLAHYQTLLEAATADPDQPIASLNMLSAAERTQLLQEWNTAGEDELLSELDEGEDESWIDVFSTKAASDE